METYRTVTFEEIWKSEEVNAYIKMEMITLALLALQSTA